MTLYDASAMRKEHVLDAVSSVLSDFDVQGNLLVTCGMSSRYVAGGDFFFLLLLFCSGIIFVIPLVQNIFACRW